MKNLTAMLLSTALIMNFALVGCAADGDAWKNNVGTINLNDMTVSGKGISVSDSTVKITSGGDFEVTGTLADGMIYVNTDDKVKLRLSGASITNSDGPAIFFDNAEKGLITITENTENYLSDGGEYAEEEADAVIFSNDDLEIKGDGKLTIDANYKHGIAGDDDVSIENGVITIDSYEHGIKVNDSLSILGGTITVNSETGKGLKADLEIIIDGGDIDITAEQDEGIESEGTLTINGGDISIVSADDGINTGTSSETTDNTQMQNGTMQKPDGTMQRPQGGQGEAMTPPEGMPEMPEGEMPADGQMRPQRGGGMGGGFGHADEETSKAHALTINGGSVYICAEGDGIDSNGYLTINGGTLTIDGPTNNGNGPIDSDGTMSITGGEMILASSAGMIQLPRGEGNQNILRIMFSEAQSAGAEVTVTEAESGDELVSHTPAKNFSAFIVSSANIESGKEYIVYINGEEAERITAADGTAQGRLSAARRLLYKYRIGIG